MKRSTFGKEKEIKLDEISFIVVSFPMVKPSCACICRPTHLCPPKNRKDIKTVMCAPVRVEAGKQVVRKEGEKRQRTLLQEESNKE